MNRGTEASRRMRTPVLKDFLALPCGEVLETVLYATYPEADDKDHEGTILRMIRDGGRS